MAEDAAPHELVRSEGIIVAGLNPGGGRSAKDPTLDAVLVETAQRLTARYGQDVTIRVNRDRLSGGAYLPGEHTVGITVSSIALSRVRDLTTEAGESFEDECVRLGVDPAGAETQHGFRVFVDDTRLRDTSMADQGGRTPYLYRIAVDLDDAMTKLEEAYAE